MQHIDKGNTGYAVGEARLMKQYRDSIDLDLDVIAHHQYDLITEKIKEIGKKASERAVKDMLGHMREEEGKFPLTDFTRYDTLLYSTIDALGHFADVTGIDSTGYIREIGLEAAEMYKELAQQAAEKKKTHIVGFYYDEYIQVVKTAGLEGVIR